MPMSTDKPSGKKLDTGLEGTSWEFVELRFGGLNFRYSDIEKRVGKAGYTVEDLSLDFARLKKRTEEVDEQYKQLSKETTKIRKAVLEELSKRTEISAVSDLFDQKEVERPGFKHLLIGPFAPLVAILQLPERFQDIDKSLPGKHAEKFMMIFDGRMIFFGAVSTEQEIVLGFPDARDKLLEIISKAATLDMVPPIVTRAGILVANSMPQKALSKRPWKACINLWKHSTMKTALKIAYISLAYQLSKFYNAASVSNNCLRICAQIRSEQGTLLSLMRDFASTRVHQVRRRRSIANLIRVSMANLLNHMSEYNQLAANHQNMIERIEAALRDDNVLRSFMEQEMWKRDVELDSFSSETVLALIEHARSEIETSGLVSITMWAAIVGALAGAIVAAVLTVLTRFF